MDVPGISGVPSRQVVFFAGNYQEYESDHRKRLETAGEDPDRPHRIKYKRLA